MPRPDPLSQPSPPQDAGERASQLAISERRLPLEVWGRAILAAAQARADRTRVGRWGFEFLMFGLKQGWASLFGGIMLALLFLTGLFWPHGAEFARYDFLVIA